jgi:ATP phosphoribosyltransferase
VLAVPEASPAKTAADLAGTIIASELVETTKKYFVDRGIQARGGIEAGGLGCAPCASLCCLTAAVPETCPAHPQVKRVEYSWGATEVKASLPGVGGIVDITETGSSLRANGLR